MQPILESWRRYLLEKNKEGEILDLGNEADEEVAICRSDIGCADFKKDFSLKEIVLSEQMSGQQSERNLVDAINNVTGWDPSSKGFLPNAAGPQAWKLGRLGTKMVYGARQEGGGNPEPKADISLILADDNTLGISMKKENFGFFANRMDETRFRGVMTEAGLEKEAQDLLVKKVKNTLAQVTQQEAKLIQEEQAEFLRIVQQHDPAYKFPAPLIKDSLAHRALATSKTFGRGGVLKNSYKIKNVYLHLSDVLGDSYRKFLTLVCRGTEANRVRADAVLIADVPSGITNPKAVQAILSKIKTIDEMVDYYIKDPKLNLRFRLRPITKVRTTYSKSNRSHYKVGERMYADPNLGISWTVFVT